MKNRISIRYIIYHIPHSSLSYKLSELIYYRYYTRDQIRPRDVSLQGPHEVQGPPWRKVLHSHGGGAGGGGGGGGGGQ